MRALLQRVKDASVEVEGEIIARISQGLVVLVGVSASDQEADAHWLARRVASLRVFCDDSGKLNFSCQDLGYPVLCVSQFTLCASLEKGARPSFLQAMEPFRAQELFDLFVSSLSKKVPTEKGRFGAHMIVSLSNDGPFTLMLESPDAK